MDLHVALAQELVDVIACASHGNRNVAGDWLRKKLDSIADINTQNFCRNLVFLNRMGFSIVNNNFQSISGNNNNAAQSTNKSNINQASGPGDQDVSAPLQDARDMLASQTEDVRQKLLDLINELELHLTANDDEKAKSTLGNVFTFAKSVAATGVYYACKAAYEHWVNAAAK